MKKYFAATLLLLFVFSVFSQDSLKNKDHFLQKSKKQKTAAWILLGGGATLTIVAGVILLGQYYVGSDENTVASVMAYTGLAAMVGSIPLFIASGRNRRKAGASVSIKMEKVTIIRPSLAFTSRYPVVAIRVCL